MQLSACRWEGEEAAQHKKQNAKCLTNYILLKNYGKD